MSFESSYEREIYLRARGKVVLNACPGSGKTTTIAYKLLTLVEECRKTHGDYCGVACLSFTNVAKDEINSKYREFSKVDLGFPHAVMTIDSFINTYITRPFIHLVATLGKQLKIVDDASVLDKMIGEQWWFYMNKTESAFVRKYSPSQIEYNLDGSAYPFRGKDTSSACLSYCEKVKAAQLKLGILKSTDSEYYALQIVTRYPQVAQWLSTRFPVIIIDEAQDTSQIQHALFDKLAESGLVNIEFIGDPYQSLYEWREARPDLFYSKYRDSNNWLGLELTNCRRSTQEIINCYQRLRLSSDSSVTSTANINPENAVHVIRFKDGDELRCVELFSDMCVTTERNCVLVRGKTLKNKLMGLSTERQLPWKSSLPYALLSIAQQFAFGNSKFAVNNMRSCIPRILDPSVDYTSARLLEEELKFDHETNGIIYRFIKQIPSLQLSLSDWTSKTERLVESTFEVTKVSFESKKGVWNSKQSTPLSTLFGVPSNPSSIPVKTIHQAKGLTLDSLLLILSESSTGQSISFSDYTTPLDFPTEKQRMLYVAKSRPSKLLVLAIPEGKLSNDEVAKKLGNNTIFIPVN